MDATDGAELFRLFVSGCGGTGKSFLIQTIRALVQAATGKDVVAAPTGIAARNVNGLKFLLYLWNMAVLLLIDQCQMMP